MASAGRPFYIAYGDLGGGFSLVPLPTAEAALLGDAFAKMDPWVSYPYPASGLASYFSAVESGAPRLALVTNNQVAGVIGLRLNWLRGPYLQFLGILPAYQRHGAGSRVLGWLEEQARAAGDRNLWVCASDFNGAGLLFYERHGFSRVADLDGLVRDGRTELLLRKRLV